MTEPRIPEPRIPDARIPEARIPEARIPEARIPESRVIRGGAGGFEAAAIAVVVQYVLEAEAAARATPPGRSVPPAWVRAAQPRAFARFDPDVVAEPRPQR